MTEKAVAAFKGGGCESGARRSSGGRLEGARGVRDVVSLGLVHNKVGTRPGAILR